MELLKYKDIAEQQVVLDIPSFIKSSWKTCTNKHCVSLDSLLTEAEKNFWARKLTFKGEKRKQYL